MLGYFTARERGGGDRLLAGLAAELSAGGLRLAGAIQHNVEPKPGARCDMVLEVLGETVARICISQRLGPGSSGCRLDPEGLEQVVGLVATSLTRPVDLLIVNKFGKQEIDGGGFRPVIGAALAQDVPVLVSVSVGHRTAFEDFADGMATEVAPTPQALVRWCHDPLGTP